MRSGGVVPIHLQSTVWNVQNHRSGLKMSDFSIVGLWNLKCNRCKSLIKKGSDPTKPCKRCKHIVPGQKRVKKRRPKLSLLKCDKCGHVWRPRSTSVWLCGSCRRPFREKRFGCHPHCYGLCTQDVADWLACRFTWKAVLRGKSLYWVRSSGKFVTVHDLMLAFSAKRKSCTHALTVLLFCNYLKRVRQNTYPPEEVGVLKDKYYLKNGKRHMVGHKKRINYPAYYQYWPNHWIMRGFEIRHPHSIEVIEEKRGTFFRPVLAKQEGKVYLEKRPSAKEAKEYERREHERLERFLCGKPRNKVGLPVSNG